MAAGANEEKFISGNLGKLMFSMSIPTCRTSIRFYSSNNSNNSFQSEYWQNFIKRKGWTDKMIKHKVDIF